RPCRHAKKPLPLAEERLFLHVLADREGFEPSIRYERIPAFQASAFNHSATCPCLHNCKLVARDYNRIFYGCKSQHPPPFFLWITPKPPFAPRPRARLAL